MGPCPSGLLLALAQKMGRMLLGLGQCRGAPIGFLEPLAVTGDAVILHSRGKTRVPCGQYRLQLLRG